jgi:hypothetical protein
MKFEISTALLTGYDADGFLGVQVDAHGSKGFTPYTLWHTYGFVSRPLDPDDDTGCTVLQAEQGRQGFAWLLNDPRVQSKVPQVKQGGSAQYASDGAFASLDPETHTWTLYVPYEFANDVATKAHVVTVGVDGNGKPIVELSSGTGLSVTLLDETITIANADGSAWIQLDANGTTVIGPLKAYGGCDLGGEASLPLAKAAELTTWAALVSAALNTLGAPVAPLSPTVATVLTKGA